MITSETLAHRRLVCDVFKEVNAFLDNKSRELTAQLDGSDFPDSTSEQFNYFMHTAELAVSYSNIAKLANKELLRYAQETLRMTQRTLNELNAK